LYDKNQSKHVTTADDASFRNTTELKKTAFSLKMHDMKKWHQRINTTTTKNGTVGLPLIVFPQSVSGLDVLEFVRASFEKPATHCWVGEISATSRIVVIHTRKNQRQAVTTPRQ
jgi:hypothetical protein